MRLKYEDAGDPERKCIDLKGLHGFKDKAYLRIDACLSSHRISVLGLQPFGKMDHFQSRLVMNLISLPN